jgi:integrase
MASVFKIKMRDVQRSSCWYGKVKTGPMQRRRVKLFSDKSASERRLRELQIEADQRASGIINSDLDRLGRPLSQLVDDYFASLARQKLDADHLRIARWMTDRLVELSGWKYFRDITRESMEKVLAKLAADGATASYQNKYIVRAKSLVNWILPDGMVSPLRKVRRVSEKGAVRHRERRAGTAVELQALFALKLPESRRLSYALAGLNGLRRNEVRKLTWERLHLDAPIPFVDLSQKMGDGTDSIPLHPYVCKLLAERTPGMPNVPVVRAVPDVATLEKDWERAKVAFADGQGRRLDYHALRHTFQTALDRTGCSRATKKRLMRHAASDVTDGYAHAELAEMQTALMRLCDPTETAVETQAMTGTDAIPMIDVAKSVDHQLDHGMGATWQSPSAMGNAVELATGSAPESLACVSTRKNRGFGDGRRSLAMSGLNVGDGVANVEKVRPGTQVD